VTAVIARGLNEPPPPNGACALNASTVASVNRARNNSLNTSGRAVLFAGATVVIALLGMFALGVSLLSGAAVAASIGVVVVMAASLTLLPAFLSLMGPRIGRVGGRQAAREADGTRPAFWLRWVQRVQRRPAVTAIAATALMLALAAPALGLRLASSDAGNDPAGQTTRQDIAERKRLILGLQERLAYVVRDLLGVQRPSPR
jgi:putative drug exporter of the RND superfamily